MNGKPRRRPPSTLDALTPAQLRRLERLLERLEYLRRVHPKSARSVEQLIAMLADGFAAQR